MPALGAGIHVFISRSTRKTWMAGTSPAMTWERCAGSQRVEEVHQILLLLIGKADAEALVVEVHRVHQRRRRAVVEIGRARRQAAQDRSFQLADVGALAGDHGAP